MYKHIGKTDFEKLHNNNRPICNWTKGKQAPANRYTYFEMIGFHVDGHDVNAEKFADAERKAFSAYNAGRTVTVYIIRHTFGLIRNSAIVNYRETRAEMFTINHKTQPLTDDLLNKYCAKVVELENGTWKQMNTFN